MDRRDFLKVTGAATVAPAALGTSPAPAVSAPALSTGTRELRLGMSVAADGRPGPSASAARLASRIETASAGRLRIVSLVHDAGPIGTIAADAADIAFGSLHDDTAIHPALAYFAGLPFYTGLDPEPYASWLAAAGGQMLWDDLAADLGSKPLFAAHMGRHPGLWLANDPEDGTGFAGLRMDVRGLGGDVVRALRAEPVRIHPEAMAAALTAGHVDAVEGAGSISDLAQGLPRAAKTYLRFGINTSGTALTLAVNLRVWNELSPSDRILFEACAAEEARLSQASQVAHAGIVLRTAQAWGVRLDHLPREVVPALSSAAENAVAALAGFDARSARIHASYMAFRAEVTSLPPIEAAIPAS